MRTADRGATQFADALRGIACLSVVCHHLVGQFLVQPGVVALYGLAQVPDGDALPVSNFFYRGGFGEFGVALFFLISGFVIPLSLERYGPRAFLIARCWRLVPTYMACFAVLLATEWLDVRYGPNAVFSVDHRLQSPARHQTVFRRAGHLSRCMDA
jgi:peptidoglycan/LPS O-acetylase OafA/YrhL